MWNIGDPHQASGNLTALHKVRPLVRLIWMTPADHLPHKCGNCGKEFSLMMLTIPAPWLVSGRGSRRKGRSAHSNARAGTTEGAESTVLGPSLRDPLGD